MQEPLDVKQTEPGDLCAVIAKVVSAALFLCCDSTTVLVTVLLGTLYSSMSTSPHLCSAAPSKSLLLLSPEKHQQPQRSLQAEELWWAKMWLESLGMVPADGTPAPVLAVRVWRVFRRCLWLLVRAVPALCSRQRSLLPAAVSPLCSLCL